MTNNNITSEQNASQVNDGSNQNTFDIDVSKLDLSDNTVAEDSNGSASNEPDNNSAELKQEESVEQIEIDPRFSNLPKAEALIRTLQSQKDKTQAEYNKIIKEYEQVTKIKDLFDKMLEDENLLRIFVNQVKPGIIPNKDYGEIIKEKLKQEFGEDYKPSLTRYEAERDDPGGIDWKYYKRLDQLEQELSHNSPDAKTVQEYLENLKKQQEIAQKELSMEIEKVKTELKADDNEIQGVVNWAKKLSIKDILTLHRFLRKFHKVPEYTSNSNSTVKDSISPNREKFLKEIFG